MTIPTQTTVTPAAAEALPPGAAEAAAAKTTRSPRSRPTKIRRSRAGAIVKWALLSTVALVMLVPFYIMVISAFKSQEEIIRHPLWISPDTFSLEYIVEAITSEKFNVIGAYGITLFFVVMVNLFGIALSAPVAYVIARGRSKWHIGLLLLFVSGLFIPGQVTLIPVVFVLRMLGLINTIPGFLLFETAITMPVTIFLLTAYLRTVPRDIDEAAALDGAGRIKAFWLCIFPIMRPAVATVVVLNSIGVWNDFVSPQIILGPSSGIYTVTTGVYAAVGQYSTDYTTVFPTLLLAILPAVVFFIFMQRHIIGGLVAGATKG
ncbi:carbohydrate ABC transporter permease [Herbiconiux sp. P15]|uniref:carbohydrate ABC transporter permease n=1 Tax=Herbiconiux liukaitaii TaxID=3342799 RepID=UPI0035B84FEE